MRFSALRIILYFSLCLAGKQQVAKVKKVVMLVKKRQCLPSECRVDWNKTPRNRKIARVLAPGLTELAWRTWVFHSFFHMPRSSWLQVHRKCGKKFRL